MSASDDAMPVLFMDTEGLFASEASAEQDAEVFALAVLLCDTLLYNSTGAISQDGITTLALACKLAHRVSSQTGGHAGVPPPASLQWVLRDFSLELVDEDGDALTPLQYMQGALQNTRASSKDAARANASRSVITSVFPQRRCVVLPPPCERPAELATGTQQPRPAFEEQLGALRSALLRPPDRASSSVTGPALLQLAQAYTESVNAGAVPSLGSAWRSATAAASTSAMQGALHEAQAVRLDTGGGAPGVLLGHALACAAAHSKLTRSTAGFEWGEGGRAGGDTSTAAWTVARPLSASSTHAGGVSLHAPAMEQVLWALHDAALPVLGAGQAQEAAAGAPQSAIMLHSAQWEQQLGAWGLPVQRPPSTCATPLQAAKGVQGALLIRSTNTVYTAQLQHRERLSQVLSEGGAGGLQGLLEGGCAPSDGALMAAAATQAAMTQLQDAHTENMHALGKEQCKWDADVAAAAREDAAATSQLAALQEEEQQVQAAAADTQTQLGDVQVLIMQAQQRVAALQARRREAAAAADAAEAATALQEQELGLAIQATRLRAQRAREDALRRDADSQRVAAAEAAAARSAAAAARARAAAEAAEARAATAAAAEAQDREAAASLQRTAPPEEIDENSGKGGGCCVLQ
mgnify:CR=1 FL=1